MLLDVQQFGNLLMGFLLEHIQVEYRSASVGKLCHKREQHLFGQPVAGLCHARLVGNVGKLLLVQHQPVEPLLPPQVVDGLRHHDSRHPGAQRALAPKGEVGENFDEAIVQHIVRRIDIARIAVAHRQHLLGVTSV